jgi:hypothetical protein
MIIEIVCNDLKTQSLYLVNYCMKKTILGNNIVKVKILQEIKRNNTTGLFKFHMEDNVDICIQIPHNKKIVKYNIYDFYDKIVLLFIKKNNIYSLEPLEIHTDNYIMNIPLTFTNFNGDTLL